MKPCIVGIGGAGGSMLKPFLQNLDLNLMIHDFAGNDRLTYGDVKGIWLESQTADVEKQKDHYYGNSIKGQYPGYLICHGGVNEDSSTNTFLKNKYGFDLKAQGYDRRAEYLKGLFEIFELDENLKRLCSHEFGGYDNALSDYMWKIGIRPLTIISTGGSTSVKDETVSSAKSKRSKPLPELLRCFLKPRNLNSDQNTKRCDCILFLASLGGGTGTGFINPISSAVRLDEPIFPIFALGMLTEKGEDSPQTSEGQRDLAAVIALYDLLTKESGKGIDGLILMDGQILKERFENYSAMDGMIYEAMKPLLDIRNYPGDEQQDEAQAFRRVLWDRDAKNPMEQEDAIQKRLFPPVLIPCYYTQPDWNGDLKSLVEGALGKKGHVSSLGLDGRLFPCDPEKAERALVFIRGFFELTEIKKAVMDRTGLSEGKIKVYRKLGDSRSEDVLILLRNPYGGEIGAHKDKGTLEWRFHDIIAESIEYIEKNEMNILSYHSYKPLTKEYMWKYFYQSGGIKDQLYKSLKYLESGRKPFFCRELRIFGESAKLSQAEEQIMVSTNLEEQITCISRREAERLLMEKGIIH